MLFLHPVKLTKVANGILGLKSEGLGDVCSGSPLRAWVHGLGN